MNASRVFRHHGHTRRDLETGLAASLGLCLLLGLLPLRVEERPVVFKRSAETLVLLTEPQRPPRTRQPVGALPPRPGIEISAPSDIPLADLPVDAVLPATHAARTTASPAHSMTGTRGDGSASAQTGDNTPPRQILEVFPEPGEGCDGSVTVLLSIGRDGRVRSHRIRRNTLGEGHCLRRVLTAMYASRWEALGEHDTRDSVIVRKTYSLD